MSPVYGIWGSSPLVIATDIDSAVIATMQEWLPTILQELSTERSLGYQLPAPNAYTNTVDPDEFMDHMLPAIIVSTASTQSTKGGANSIWQATWRVKVSAVVRGRKGAEARATAALFEGAVRRVFLWKCRQDSGPLSDPHWVSSNVGLIPDTTGKGRYLAAGVGIYNVATDAAAQSFGGPDVPNAASYVPLPPATVVEITVQADDGD